MTPKKYPLVHSLERDAILDAEERGRKETDPALRRGLRPHDSLYVTASLDDTQKVTEQLIDRLVTQEGVHVVQSPFGGGKSTGAGKAVARRLGSWSKVAVALPTCPTRNERAEAFRQLVKSREDEDKAATVLTDDRGTRIDIRRSRENDTCLEFDAYRSHQSAVPDGGLRFCQSCKHNQHSSNFCGTICPFLSERGDRALGRTVEFTTHEALVRACASEAAKQRSIQVQWREICGAAIRGHTVRPVAQKTANHWRITVESSTGDASPSPILVEGDDYKVTTDSKGKNRIEVLAPGEAKILNWLARSVGDGCCPDAANILKGLRARGHIAHELDLLVIDEDIIRQQIQMMPLDEDALRSAREAGELDWPPLIEQRIFDLLAESRQFDEDSLRHHRIGPDALRKAAPPQQVRVSINGYRTGMKAISAAKEDQPSALKHCPDWRALEGLKDTTRAGWEGAYIYKGKLYVPFIRQPDWHARTILVLDATGDPDITRAVFGDELTFHRIVAPKPDDLKVAQVRDNLSGAIVKPDGCFSSRRLLRVWAAVHLGFDSPRTLHIVPTKRWSTANGELGDLMDALRDGEEGRLIYTNSPLTRGSNEFEGFERVIHDTYFCAGGPIESAAYSLCKLAGDDWNDPTSHERWTTASEFQHNIAPVLHAIHRIRPLRATVDEPKFVVIADHRDLSEYDPLLEVDEFIDPDHLVVDRLGVPYSAEGAIRVVQRMCEQSPTGGWLVGVESGMNLKELWAGSGKTIDLPNSLFGDRESDLIHRDVSDYVTDACDRHFAGNRAKLAEAAGLCCEFVQASLAGGGAKLALFSRKPLSHAEVRATVKGAPIICHGYEFRGQDVTFPAYDLFGALMRAGFHRAGDVCGKKAHERIADELGVSPVTVKRRVSRAGGISEVRATFAEMLSLKGMFAAAKDASDAPEQPVREAGEWRREPRQRGSSYVAAGSGLRPPPSELALDIESQVDVAYIVRQFQSSLDEAIRKPLRAAVREVAESQSILEAQSIEQDPSTHEHPQVLSIGIPTTHAPTVAHPPNLTLVPPTSAKDEPGEPTGSEPQHSLPTTASAALKSRDGGEEQLPQWFIELPQERRRSLRQEYLWHHVRKVRGRNFYEPTRFDEDGKLLKHRPLPFHAWLMQRER